MESLFCVSFKRSQRPDHFIVRSQKLIRDSLTSDLFSTIQQSMSFFKKLFGRDNKKELEKQAAEAKRIAEEQERAVAEKAAQARRTIEQEEKELQQKIAEAQRISDEKQRVMEQEAAQAKQDFAEKAKQAEAAVTLPKIKDVADKIEEKAKDATTSFENKIAEKKEAIDNKLADKKEEANEVVKDLKQNIPSPPPPVVEKPKVKPPAAEKPKSKSSFWGRKKDLDKGLEKTKTSFFGKLSRAVAGKSTVDEEVLDEVEQILITSDVGLETTIKIIERIEARVARDKYLNTSELNSILRDEIVQLLAENNTEDVHDFSVPAGKKPYIMLVVGVNGVGKTTTIGKLAYQLTQQGKKVVIGAGDTFRAAAVDQLEIWANRVGCDFFSKGMYTDPAAVAFETTQYAIDNNCDVAIIDTAGRLHTKVNLMKELGKIKRSVGKCLDGAPHDVMLVLDATTGQNAIEQATKFTAATDVSCLALTKLDGTAKGGVAIGISDQFKIPIKYIGIGEGMEQLQVFNKRDFVESMFGDATIDG